MSKKDELRDAIVAAETFREERDEALAEVARLQALLLTMQPIPASGQSDDERKRERGTWEVDDDGALKSQERRNVVMKAARDIDYGMSWVRTPQGGNYWVDVYNHLVTLGGNPSMKRGHLNLILSRAVALKE